MCDPQSLFSVVLQQKKLPVLNWNRRRLTVQVDHVPAAGKGTFELFRLAPTDGGETTKVRESLGDLERHGDGNWSRDVSVGSVGSAYVAEVTLSLSEGAKSVTVPSSQLIVESNTRARLVGLGLSVALILLMVFLALTWLTKPGGPWNLDNGPLLGATSVLLAWFLAIGVLGRLRRVMLVGEDNRVSTSKTAVFYWTAAVGFVMSYFIFLGIGGQKNCGPEGVLDCTLPNLLAAEGLPTAYVLLLGAPFAALLGSQALTGAKVEAGTTQKTMSETTPSAGEAFQNDAGHADLVDAQYLLFTLIAALFFVVSFVTTPKVGLPAIPTVLVALTGVSAATYVGKKAVDSNPLEITGIDPPAPVAGETVAILGRNFLPDGALTVKVDLGGTPVVPAKATNTRIELTIPRELDPAGLVVTVTTAANSSATSTLAGSKYLTAVVTPGQVLPGEQIEIWLPRTPNLPEGDGVLTAVVGAGGAVEVAGQGPFTMAVPMDTPNGTGQVISVRKDDQTIAQASIDIVTPSLTVNPTRLARDTPFTVAVPAQLQSETLQLQLGAANRMNLPGLGLTRVVSGGVGESLQVELDVPAIATLIHNGKVAAQTQVTLIPTPTVTAIEPMQAKSGEVITVSGGGLQSAGSPTVIIHVGGVLATPILTGPERIIARAGEGIAVLGDVHVTRSDTGSDITP